MNRIKFWAVIFVCALLQVTVLDAVRVFGVKPDLLLICVVIASLNFERGFAILASLCCGILKDSLSVTAFGVHTLLFPVLSAAIVFVARKIALDSVALVGIATFFVILVYDILNRTLYSLLGHSISVLTYLRISFLHAVYTAAVFPPVFRLIKKLV